MVRDQQTTVGNVIDDGRGGVDGNGHRLDRVGGIAADQTDGIPGLRQRWRIGSIENLDDVRQPHRHSEEQ